MRILPEWRRDDEAVFRRSAGGIRVLHQHFGVHQMIQGSGNGSPADHELASQVRGRDGMEGAEALLVALDHDPSQELVQQDRLMNAILRGMGWAEVQQIAVYCFCYARSRQGVPLGFVTHSGVRDSTTEQDCIREGLDRTVDRAR